MNTDIAIPEVFNGYFLYLMETNIQTAMNPLPTYYTEPPKRSGFSEAESVPLTEAYYRVAEGYLERAVNALDRAEPMVANRCQTVYEAETLPIRWFYHTVKTCGNVYECFRLRNKADKASLLRLENLLVEEKENTLQAMPIAQKDPRIDTLHRGDHSFHSLRAMMQAKIQLLNMQIVALQRKKGV